MGIGFSGFVWVSDDMSEQVIINSEGHYALVKISGREIIELGHTLEAAKEKLKELNRYDIIKHLE